MGRERGRRWEERRGIKVKMCIKLNGSTHAAPSRMVIV
jgi:hypothetical protein